MPEAYLPSPLRVSLVLLRWWNLHGSQASKRLNHFFQPTFNLLEPGCGSEIWAFKIVATTAELRDRLNTGLELLGLDLDSRQCEQLLTYVALLDKWNRVFNLTAVRDPMQMVSRHILDSLTTLQYIAGNSMIDIGTGAGLPGIPVAIACPQLSCTLLDSNGKKTRFVQQTLAELGLSNANVIQCRVEDSELGTFDNIITRAFSSPVDIIAKCEHLCSADGLMIFMMAVVDQQFGDLPNGFVLERLIPLEVPFEEGVRHIAIVRKQAMR